jgi:hypothetical protein
MDCHSQAERLVTAQRRGVFGLGLGGLSSGAVGLVLVSTVSLAGRKEGLLWAPVVVGAILIVAASLGAVDYTAYTKLMRGEAVPVRFTAAATSGRGRHCVVSLSGVESYRVRPGLVTPRSFSASDEAGVLYGRVERGRYYVVAGVDGAFCGRVWGEPVKLE